MKTKKRMIEVGAFANCPVFSCGGNPDDPYYEGYCDALDNVINWLEHFPTVDAVEVVRCKDCVYCSTKRGNRYNQLLRFCEWGDGHEKVQSDGKFFCAHGKRSEYAVD